MIRSDRISLDYLTKRNAGEGVEEVPFGNCNFEVDDDENDPDFLDLSSLHLDHDNNNGDDDVDGELNDSPNVNMRSIIKLQGGFTFYS